MSVKAMRQAAVIVCLTGIAMGLSAYLVYRYALRYPDRPAGEPGDKVALVIPNGANFPRVVELLHQQKLITSAVAFRVYVNYKGLAAKIRAGTYAFPADITPRTLLQILVHGVPAPQVEVLIPEGKNMIEVAELLAAAEIAPKEALLKEMRNRRFLHRLGVPGETIEGYLFPDTYKLRAHTPPQEVLTKLCQRHMGVYNTLTANHKAGLKALRMKLRWGHPEIVILASIVEKETGQKSERPLIAGVFLNRLVLSSFYPRLLQTDPTIVYGCTVPLERSSACKKFEGRIRRIHLDDDQNPYNTYRHAGLPPGPIANPGRAALEAVLAPQKTGYLYFVSKNDGTHHFSATKAEHELAVDRYQRRASVSPD
jgi:UPF0755 protein